MSAVNKAHALVKLIKVKYFSVEIHQPEFTCRARTLWR